MAVKVVIVLAYLILAPLIGGLLDGLDRIISARMQRRKGPSILQPFYDLGKLFSKQVFERRNIGDPFVAAPFGVDAVGLSERGVKFALGRAVDLHVVRLRPLSVPDEVSPADMDDFVAGGADRDDVLQFLDVFFVVVAPDFVRFQSSRPAAHAASAARARIGGAAQSVPHFFGKRASQVCIPAAVGDELKTQFSFIHAPILAHSEKKYNSRAGNKKAQIVG